MAISLGSLKLTVGVDANELNKLEQQLQRLDAATSSVGENLRRGMEGASRETLRQIQASVQLQITEDRRLQNQIRATAQLQSIEDRRRQQQLSSESQLQSAEDRRLQNQTKAAAQLAGITQRNADQAVLNAEKIAAAQIAAQNKAERAAEQAIATQQSGLERLMALQARNAAQINKGQIQEAAQTPFIGGFKAAAMQRDRSIEMAEASKSAQMGQAQSVVKTAFGGNLADPRAIAELAKLKAQIEEVNRLKLDAIDQEFNNLWKRMAGMPKLNFDGAAMTGVISGITSSLTSTLIGAFQSAGRSALGFADDIKEVGFENERVSASFKTLLKSGEASGQMMEEIRALGKVTPFETKDLQESGRMLLSMGVPAKSLIDNLKVMGDLAAGTGTRIKDLAYVFGTSLTVGKIYTRDLNQLATRGIPIYEMMAKQLGVNEAKLREMTAAGRVSYNDLAKAAQASTQDGGRYFGAMTDQMGTVFGKVSNLKDIFDDIKIKIFESFKPLSNELVNLFANMFTGVSANTGFFDTIKVRAQELADYLKANPQYAQELGAALNNVATQGFTALLDGARGVLNYLKENPTAVQDLIAKLQEAIGFVGNFVKGLGQGFKEAFDAVKPALEKMGLLDKAGTDSSTLAQNMGKAAAYMITFNTAAGVALPALSGLASLVQLFGGLGKVIGGIGIFFGGIGTTIATIVGTVTMWFTGVGNVAAAMNPIGVAIAAIGLTIYNIIQYTLNWSDFCQGVQYQYEVIVEAVGNIFNWIGKTIGQSTFFQSVWSKITEVISFLLKPFVDVFNWVKEGIARSTTFQGIWSGLVGISKSVGDAFNSSIGGALNGLVTKAQELFGWMKQMAGMGNGSNNAGSTGEAFASGLFTSPEANNGGSAAYHIDNKFARDLPHERVVAAMDAMAKAYEAQGREIEFSNSAIAGQKYNVNDPNRGEMIKKAFDAHSHSVSADYNSLDYYVPKKGKGRDDASVENVEMMLPNLGGKTEYGTGGRYGNHAFLYDSSGKLAMKAGHGNDSKALPSNRSPQAITSGGGGGGPSNGSNSEADDYITALTYIKEGQGANVALENRAKGNYSGYGASMAQQALAGTEANPQFAAFKGYIGTNQFDTKEGVIAAAQKYGISESQLREAGSKAYQSYGQDQQAIGNRTSFRTTGSFDGSNSISYKGNNYLNEETWDGVDRRPLRSSDRKAVAPSSSPLSALGSSATSPAGDISVAGKDIYDNKEEREALKIARTGEDEKRALQRTADKRKKQEKRDAQELTIKQSLSTVNDPLVRDALTQQSKKLSVDAKYGDKIEELEEAKRALQLKSTRKGQDLGLINKQNDAEQAAFEKQKASGAMNATAPDTDTKEAKRLRALPDYSKYAKDIDTSLTALKKQRDAELGIESAEYDRGVSNKNRDNDRLIRDAAIQRSLETQKRSLLERIEILKNTPGAQSEVKKLTGDVGLIDTNLKTGESIRKQQDKITDAEADKGSFSALGAAALKLKTKEIAEAKAILAELKLKQSSELAIINEQTNQTNKEGDRGTREADIKREIELKKTGLNEEIALLQLRDGKEASGQAKTAQLALERVNHEEKYGTELRKNQDEIDDMVSGINKYTSALKATEIPDDPHLKKLNEEMTKLLKAQSDLQSQSDKGLSIISEKDIKNAREYNQLLREVQLGKESLLQDSDNQVVSAKATYLKNKGDNFGANDLERGNAIDQEQLANQKRRAGIESSVRSTFGDITSPEAVAALEKLRSNAEQLNALNLENISSQFKSLGRTVLDLGQSAFQDFFTSILDGSKSVGDSFRDMVKNIAGQLAKLAVNRIFMQILGGSIGGGGVAKAGGGLLSGLFGSSVGVAYAGGYVSGAGIIANYASGGEVGDMRSGFGNISAALQREGSNSVLAALTPGEIVLNTRQAQKYKALGLSRVLNFAQGGTVGSVSALNSGGGNVNVTVPITINSNNAGGVNWTEAMAQLAPAFKGMINSEIDRQQRPGGQLSG